MAYLTEENVFQAYKDASSYMRPFLDPLDEYDRIARNRPHPNIDKMYPRVTDGTTASMVRKTPRRIVQQIPTGVVKGNGWLPIVANFIFTDRIIPNANEQNAFIDKCWLMIRRALTFGASHSVVPFINRGDYFGPDMKVPYIKNVKFQVGKVSDLESHCEFIESWFQTADIESIIAQEKKLKASAKERGEKYESTWDLKALEEIKDDITQKADDEKATTPSANRNDTAKDGVKLVLALQDGIGATFYTFHPSTERIVRRKKNKDPRGVKPSQTMYFETDGLNPLGVGLVEMLAPLQNLTDSEMQMYQYNRALMLNPPIEKRGTYNKSTLKFRPNAIWDMGTDANNSATPAKIDSTAIANFPNNYGLLKSQMLSIASSPDASTSATVGNPGFSKTDAGVKQIDSNVSVDDNYIRKQFETWFERWAETAINLYFAERTGVEELELDNETAAKLRKLEETGDLEPGFVSTDNKILINYDTATEALKFEVDASTSNMKNDTQQLEALDGLFARLEKSTVLQGIVPPEKVVGAWNSVVAASGVENPEELSVSKEELAEQQQKAAEAAQAQAAMQGQPPIESETLPPQEELPPEEPMSVPQGAPQLDDDEAFIEALQGMGYSDEQIQRALAMDQMGVPNEEIMDVLEMSYA